MKNLLTWSPLVLLMVTIGCVNGSNGNANRSPSPTDASADKPVFDDPGINQGEPDYITVQHILIAFEGRLPGKTIRRSKAEAEELARQLFEQAQQPESDFAAMVKEYTDDAYPGIYRMANHGVPENAGSDATTPVYPRSGMVPAFGDTGFPLQVGDVGLAEYDPTKSPYGYHIVKRIK